MRSALIRYLLYTILLVAFMYISFEIIVGLQEQIIETYQGGRTLFLVSMLIHIIFGLSLAAESFVRQFRKAGSWQANTAKLIGFCLPFFLLSLLPLLLSYGVPVPFAQEFPHLVQGVMSAFANTALGYGLLSSFDKQ